MASSVKGVIIPWLDVARSCQYLYFIINQSEKWAFTDNMVKKTTDNHSKAFVVGRVGWCTAILFLVSNFDLVDWS